MKLIFPKNDKRADGKPFNPKRPWLFQGARCNVVPSPKFYQIFKVQFNGAPKGNYDLVSPEFLKSDGKK